MLKLIPSETDEKGSKEPKKTPKIGLRQFFMRKIETQQNADQKIIHFAVVKLQDYIKRGEKQGGEEIGELINHLQRSILSLQRKRTKMSQKNRKRK
ncbi:MAG: hypothetical protein WC843_00065 [Candidatus Gracilibacteria bacterium]|jgi:hypothetical protein